MKFGPLYELKIEVNPDPVTGQARDSVTIALPYTVEFTVSRENQAVSQHATFVVYNLGEKTRNLIYKDLFAVNQFRGIQFRAGYTDIGTPLIFNGAIYQAYSCREGTDFRTVIECFDGGFAMNMGTSMITIGSGASFREILERLSSDLPRLTGSPIIGNFPGVTSRGSTYVGNTWNYIVQLTSGLATIDNNQFKALSPNEVLQGEIPVITSESGLLGSPKRANTTVEYDMLFEPRLTVGQLVDLESQTNRIFNGAYKVVGFVHSGLISESAAGVRRTRVLLWKGTEAFSLVPGVPQ